MIPRVTKGGSSFRGAFLYYMHDREADTRERIEWTHTHNMLTDDPDKAWKIMAYTAKAQNRLKEASGQRMTGRKTEKPVLAYSLSWHPSHDPDKEHMLETAMLSLKVLGLEDHEAVVIAHRDTPHRHVHVVANRIHPISGLVASNSHSHRKLSEFAREYQQENNMNHCPQREENHKKREEGKKTKYRDPIIQNAWNASDNGRSFALALKEQGYQLAQGRKRIVVVDRYGKAINPVRNIEGVKTKEFNARLGDLDLASLPDATELARKVSEERKRPKEVTPPEISPAFNEASKERPSSPAELANVSNIEPEPQALAPTPVKVTEEMETQAIQSHAIETLSKKLNRTQERQLKEQSELSKHYNRWINHEEKNLSSFYRMEEQRGAIKKLQAKCSNPPWWRKLLGLARKDKRELASLKLNYKDAKLRYEERIDTLKNEHKAELAKLVIRQRKEWTREQEYVQQKIQNCFWERSVQRGQNRENSGPSIEPE